MDQPFAFNPVRLPGFLPHKAPMKRILSGEPERVAVGKLGSSA
jgi:hypothetical protein